MAVAVMPIITDELTEREHGVFDAALTWPERRRKTSRIRLRCQGESFDPQRDDASTGVGSGGDVRDVERVESDEGVATYEVVIARRRRRSIRWERRSLLFCSTTRSPNELWGQRRR